MKHPVYKQITKNSLWFSTVLKIKLTLHLAVFLVFFIVRSPLFLNWKYWFNIRDEVSLPYRPHSQNNPSQVIFSSFPNAEISAGSRSNQSCHVNFTHVNSPSGFTYTQFNLHRQWEWLGSSSNADGDSKNVLRLNIKWQLLNPNGNVKNKSTLRLRRTWLFSQ